MKKVLSLCLAVLLLLSLTACGKTDLLEEANYRYGMEQLGLGNFAKAYDYFRDSTDPRAAEMLEKFVFVPTTVTRTDSKGRDAVYTYTYDEQGNLLTETHKGSETSTETYDDMTTYTYTENNQTLSKTYHTDGKTGDYFLYTYDEKGHELTYTYYNAAGEGQYGTVYTYNEDGQFLTKEYWDRTHPRYAFTETYTYDEQGRLLTRVETAPDGNVTFSGNYTYAEDGSYRYTVDFVEDDQPFTSTYWYDGQDRMLKTEVLNKTKNEVVERIEIRYDEQGNVLYSYALCHGDERVETSTYDEQGNLLTYQVEDNGKVSSTDTYTYNEAGLPLTYTQQTSYSDWASTVYIYDEKNRLLSQDEMSDTQWKSTLYTYDEQGYVAQKERKGYHTDFICKYTYDTYGNVLTVEYDEQRADNSIYFSAVTMEWTVRYYPDGYSKQVSTVLLDAQRWLKTSE